MIALSVGYINRPKQLEQGFNSSACVVLILQKRLKENNVKF